MSPIIPGFFIVLGVLVGVLFYKRRDVALAVAILIYLLVPSAVGVVRLGAPIPSLHVGTIYVLCLAGTWVLLGKSSAEKESLRALPMLLHFIMALVVLAGLLSGAPSSGGYGLIINQIIAPYLLFVMCYNTARFDYRFPQNFALMLVAISTFEATLAVLIWSGALPQPWRGGLSGNYWWGYIGERQLGTLDHPLHLGLLLAATLPLIVYVRKPYLQLFCFSAILLGAVTTQSRLALVGCLASVLYLMFTRVRANRRIAFILVGLVGYAVVSRLQVAETIRQRISDDMGSTRAREYAWTVFGESWNEFAFRGLGPINQYFQENGLGTSGESAFILYSVAFGIITTLVYLGCMLWVVFSGIKRFGVSPGVISAMVAFVIIQFYASIGYESAAGVIVWLTLVAAITLPPLHRRVSTDNPNSGRRAENADLDGQFPAGGSNLGRSAR